MYVYVYVHTHTYPDTQKVAMLLGSIPPKLDRQHEKANLENTSPLMVPFPVVITIHIKLFSFHYQQSVRFSFAIILNGLITQSFFPGVFTKFFLNM